MRIFIADDHPIFLEAISNEVERGIPGVAVTNGTNLETLFDLGDAVRDFDVIITDYAMPGMDGGEGIRQILSKYPDARVAVMSGVAKPAEVKAMVNQGAKGFIPKTLTGNAFVAAVTLIAAGGTFVPTDYLDVGQAGGPGGDASAPASINGVMLTPRESEVLTHIVDGQSNKEIARNLEIEEVTVKLHARRIFQKLGVKNRVQAAKAALEHGLTAAS